jgi:hypothetical protein
MLLPRRLADHGLLMRHLSDTLSLAYDQLGFAVAAGGDEVFRHPEVRSHFTPKGAS